MKKQNTDLRERILDVMDLEPMRMTAIIDKVGIIDIKAVEEELSALIADKLIELTSDFKLQKTGEHPIRVVFYFKSKEQKNCFLGQLCDGWGESACCFSWGAESLKSAPSVYMDWTIDYSGQYCNNEGEYDENSGVIADV